MRDFGIWAMIGFWASAIGGILMGISWARRRNRNPADPELIRRSLKRRLEAGEIDQAEYERRLAELDRPSSDA